MQHPLERRIRVNVGAQAPSKTLEKKDIWEGARETFVGKNDIKERVCLDAKPNLGKMGIREGAHETFNADASFWPLSKHPFFLYLQPISFLKTPSCWVLKPVKERQPSEAGIGNDGPPHGADKR